MGTDVASTVVQELSGPHAIPIPLRPPPKQPTLLRSILFIVLFDFGLLCIHGTQLLLQPLRLIDRRWYEAGIASTKGMLGTLLVLICQLFAPTKIVITTEGMDESIFVKDKLGKVVSIELPKKLVTMANHQVYLDWWYLWALTYFMNTHSSVYIMLKDSLKWIPIVGWGMQFFDFIFMARSWAHDRQVLEKHLGGIGKRAQKNDDPLTLMIFPEGTLVSKDTRPLSKKYADKTGIVDMSNTLLPRSTGIHFSLRSLSPSIPDLHLLDITVGYPGIPPAGYGQTYYTLRSVFMDGIPPPAVHYHLRMYKVDRDVPIGDVRVDGDKIKIDATEEEKTIFDKWLRDRWAEKDHLLDGFYQKGKFTSETKRPSESSADPKAGLRARNGNTNGTHVMGGDEAVVIPLELRKATDALYAFNYALPAWAIWAGLRVKAALSA